MIGMVVTVCCGAWLYSVYHWQVELVECPVGIGVSTYDTLLRAPDDTYRGSEVGVDDLA
jgi:hypothetical protein